jgi:hypothetical protein
VVDQGGPADDARNCTVECAAHRLVGLRAAADRQHISRPGVVTLHRDLPPVANLHRVEVAAPRHVVNGERERVRPRSPGSPA